MNLKDKLFDNFAPAADALISSYYYTNNWDASSIVLDFSNIFIATGKEIVADTVVHADTFRYNFVKLVADVKSGDSSNEAIGADFVNLVGSGMILASDFVPAGRIKILGKMLELKTLGNIAGIGGVALNFMDKNNITFSPKDHESTYITIDSPYGSYTITVPTEHLQEQGILDENGNFINGSLSGNGFNLNDGDKDNDKNDDKDNDKEGQDGENGDGSGNPSNNGGGTNPPQPQKYQPPTPPSKNPPSNGWDGGFKHAIDPVVLNLSEEGKANSLENSFSHFDYDGDGFAEHTAWIGDKQGLLVVDINENGIIDDGSELLGEQTNLKNGRQAVDGYWALKDLNVIKDKEINSKDSSWSKLRVWVDNGDGVTQYGELKTLDELGITSIKFNSKKITSTDAEGNKLKSIGFFVRSDGTTGEIRDYYFETDKMNTFNKTRVAISEEVSEELYLPESGKIESSWQIMMKSEDDSLKNLLRAYQNATDSNEKSDILDKILYTMAGNTDDSSSRGNYIDARKLNVIEKFYGSEYDGGKNPTQWTAPLILKLYGNIDNYILQEYYTPHLQIKIFF